MLRLHSISLGTPMIRTQTMLLLGSALVLAACGRSEAPEPVAPVPAAPVEAPMAGTPDPADASQSSATAMVRLDAVGDSGAGGELRFAIENGAVLVTGTLTGLEPGATHAFHVHETGDCSAPDASSAGGHFNPEGAPHGSREAGGPHHAGDMPNQTANDAGEATVDQRLEGLEIASGGEKDIVGKAVIVHEQADDYSTQPTGNAGGRIACGVIVAGAPTSTTADPAQ
jgi:Cu-Zn family superoxide dismutase